MRELRKIKKAVNCYLKLIATDQQNARRYCKEYLQDVDILQTTIEAYIDQTSKIFKDWCKASVNVFDLPENNILQKIKKMINLKIVNHYLNKFSYELSASGLLQKKLTIIKERLTQYQYFT